jgi:carbamoylphosphate synthase large subunit
MAEQGYGRYVPLYYHSRDTIRYPCIVKPESGSFGRGQRIVTSAEELGKALEKDIVSEYIPGQEEYASNIFFLSRQDFLDITYLKTCRKPYFILGRERREYFVDKTVATPCLDIFLDILAALRFRGICCIDYKMADNRPLIFEINARIGYTLASSPEDMEKMVERYLARATQENGGRP